MFVRVKELLLCLRGEVAQDLAELVEFILPLRVVAGDIVCDYGRDKGSVEGWREFFLEAVGTFV